MDASTQIVRDRLCKRCSVLAKECATIGAEVGMGNTFAGRAALPGVRNERFIFALSPYRRTCVCDARRFNSRLAGRGFSGSRK